MLRTICGRSPCCDRQRGTEPSPEMGEYWWQVQDSNLCRLSPTDLQSAPIGRSGNLPGRTEVENTPLLCE